MEGFRFHQFYSKVSQYIPEINTQTGCLLPDSELDQRNAFANDTSIEKRCSEVPIDFETLK